MAMPTYGRRDLLKMVPAAIAGAAIVKGVDTFFGSPVFGAQATTGGYQGVAEDLGHYIYLTPQKLGGGTHAVDLQSNKTLAWISYWNYGDSCPISHHLAAFPADSGDPYKGFEFVNSTQGGDNVMIYGLPTAHQRIRPAG